MRTVSTHSTAWLNMAALREQLEELVRGALAHERRKLDDARSGEDDHGAEL